jgi:hypothetical protein
MLKKMNLAGPQDKITCPLLNLSATGEGYSQPLADFGQVLAVRVSGFPGSRWQSA